MLRVARTWKWLALVGLGIGALGWLVVTSSSFETCMGGAQIQQSNQSPENGATEFITALHIYKTCTGVFIDQNGGSITAIATIAIAAFTVLLTRVSNKQAELTKTTAAAVLSAELPIIFVQDIQLSEWGGYLSGSTVISEGGPPPEDCRVDITFHNYGRSVAVLTAVCIDIWWSAFYLKTPLTKIFVQFLRGAQSNATNRCQLSGNRPYVSYRGRRD